MHLISNYKALLARLCIFARNESFVVLLCVWPPTALPHHLKMLPRLLSRSPLKGTTPPVQCMAILCTLFSHNWLGTLALSINIFSSWCVCVCGRCPHHHVSFFFVPCFWKVWFHATAIRQNRNLISGPCVKVKQTISQNFKPIYSIISSNSKLFHNNSIQHVWYTSD